MNYTVETLVKKRANAEERNRQMQESMRALNPTFRDAAELDPIGARMAASLTLKERDVVGCIALGHDNAEICRTLSISIDTVKKHIWNICEKLGLDTRLKICVAVYTRPALKAVITTEGAL